MKYVLSSFLLYISLLSFSQVGDIKHDVEVDISKPKPQKKQPIYSTSPNRSTSTSQTNSYQDSLTNQAIGSGIGAIVQLVGFVFKGLYDAQVTTLKNVNKNPELISLESINKIGNFGKQDGFVFSPHLRGNWGIFSTNLRVQTIHDHTGTLTTTDWQVIQFNLPIEILKISYGIGPTFLSEYNHSYIEQTIRGEVRFAERRGTVSLEYRIAKNGDDSVFRKETNAFIDYELLKRNKFQLSPSLMISKHTYFNTTKQLYIGGGVNIRVF